MKEIQKNIFSHKESIYTKAQTSNSVYGEKFIEFNGDLYRNWDPNRSKAAAAVKNDIDLEINEGDNILYLGAASGTTVSHFSDIVEKGFIYAVEYSETTIRDLIEVAEDRENIAPILGDARNPKEYPDFVETSDVVFQDISQKDQPEIFIKNCKNFLKEDGVALIAVKAQSISTSENPESIYSKVKSKLTDHFDIIDECLLDPYERDHLFLKMKIKESK